MVRNLDSLVTAMASDWELILIDDASSDNSLKIALQ